MVGGVREGPINRIHARHSCESRNPVPLYPEVSQTLDPSFRWDDEQNQRFLRPVPVGNEENPRSRVYSGEGGQLCPPPFTTSRRRCRRAKLTAATTSAVLSAATAHALGSEAQASAQPLVWVSAGLSPTANGLSSCLSIWAQALPGGDVLQAANGGSSFSSRPPTCCFSCAHYRGRGPARLARTYPWAQGGREDGGAACRSRAAAHQQGQQGQGDGSLQQVAPFHRIAPDGMDSGQHGRLSPSFPARGDGWRAVRDEPTPVRDGWHGDFGTAT